MLVVELVQLLGGGAPLVSPRNPLGTVTPPIWHTLPNTAHMAYWYLPNTDFMARWSYSTYYCTHCFYGTLLKWNTLPDTAHVAQ